MFTYDYRWPFASVAFCPRAPSAGLFFHSIRVAEMLMPDRNAPPSMCFVHSLVSFRLVLLPWSFQLNFILLREISYSVLAKRSTPSLLYRPRHRPVLGSLSRLEFGARTKWRLPSAIFPLSKSFGRVARTLLRIADGISTFVLDWLRQG